MGGWSPKQNGHGMLRSTQPPPTRGAPNLIALCSLSGQAGDVRSVAERFQTKDKMTPTMIFFHLKIVLKPLKVAISDSRDIKNRILYNFGVHLNRFSALNVHILTISWRFLFFFRFCLLNNKAFLHNPAFSLTEDVSDIR